MVERWNALKCMMKKENTWVKWGEANSKRSRRGIRSRMQLNKIKHSLIEVTSKALETQRMG